MTDPSTDLPFPPPVPGEEYDSPAHVGQPSVAHRSLIDYPVGRKQNNS